ncbi:MAG: Eco57I restriction-modification methylase domain-containing protein [Sphingobium sp.]
MAINASQLFNEKILKNSVRAESRKGEAPPQTARDRILFWIQQLERGVLRRVTEGSAEQTFNNEIFGTVLGYHQLGQAIEATLVPKRTGPNAAHTPDFVLGRFDLTAGIEDWVAVGEVKNAATDLDQPQLSRKNKETPVEQAFRYATHGRPGVEWIIVSNFEEVRLYRNGFADACHRWRIRDLKDEALFLEFYFLLRPAGLLNIGGPGFANRLFAATIAAGKDLTEGFYALYRRVQTELVDHLSSEPASLGMPLKDLYGKAHKLLNRALFIAFCEDHPAGLLPRNTLRSTLDRSRALGASFGYWNEFSNLFDALNRGAALNGIAYNAFNGGLFARDPYFENVRLPNSLFERRFQTGKGRKLSHEISGIFGFGTYDFADDLNAQALGAIFEQSLKDLPDGEAPVRGAGQVEVSSQEISGVYYTPREITYYMVRRALDLHFQSLWREVEVDLEAQVASDPRRARRPLSATEREIARYRLYADKLPNSKVIDPACGSGAFLVEVLGQLHGEYERVNRTLAGLLKTPGQLSTSDLDRQILRTNLFGRDILPESVEISRLSIWLQTARRDEALETLDTTILSADTLRTTESDAYDLVIGNPPWGAALDDWSEEEVRARFPQSGSERDTYALFCMRGAEMLKPGGILAFIIPNSWLTVRGYTAFRRWLFEAFEIIEVANVWKIFRDVNHDACILIARKRTGASRSSPQMIGVKALARGKSETGKLADIQTRSWWIDHETTEAFQLSQADMRFEVIYPPKVAAELDKVAKRARRLEDVADVTVGIQVYHHSKVSKSDIKAKVFHGTYKRGSDWYRFVDANDAQRYMLREADNQWLQYSDRLRDKRPLSHYQEPRILVQQIFWQRMSAVLQTPVETTLYLNTIFSISNARGLPLAAVLGVINSRFISASYERRANRLFGDKFPKVSRIDLANMPIPKMTPELAGELAQAASDLQENWNALRHGLRDADINLNFANNGLKLADAGSFWIMDDRAFSHWALRTAGLLSPQQANHAQGAYRTAKGAVNNYWHRIVDAEKQVEELVAKAFQLPDALIEALSDSYFEPKINWAMRT